MVAVGPALMTVTAALGSKLAASPELSGRFLRSTLDKSGEEPDGSRAPGGSIN